MAIIERAGLALALLLGAGGAAASGGALPFDFDADPGNQPSLQRGARDFMHYCSGCHSMKYLRHNRIAQDLGIPEDMMKKYLMVTTDKPGEPVLSAMPAESEQWFGRRPPDLSLTTRLRGPAWVYSYLMSFYLDPSRPTGVNNTVLPNASMPHVLWELQGWQRKVEHAAGTQDGHHRAAPFELVVPGKLSPEEYAARVGDLTNFMAYAAEPGRQRRMSAGVLALLFAFALTVCAYFLKREYWKDVH